jgi:hypothetical protein
MNKLISIIVVSLLLFSIACDNVSDTKPEDISDVGISSFPPEYIPPVMSYEDVGIIHNQACEHIYQILKNEQLTGNLNSSEDVLFHSRNSGIDYLDVDLHLNWANITTDQYNSKFDYFTTEVFDETKLWTPDVENTLTLTQKDILNQLNTIIDNGTNLGEIVGDITVLETYAQSVCNDDEIVVIMSGLSVARHSLAYWHDNLAKWQQLPYLQKMDRGSNGARILAINWQSAAKADIAGAIGGGVAGALLGGIAGAISGAAAGGVGAIPGAVAGAMVGARVGAVGAAIAATVGDVCMQIMNDWGW